MYPNRFHNENLAHVINRQGLLTCAITHCCNTMVIVRGCKYLHKTLKNKNARDGIIKGRHITSLITVHCYLYMYHRLNVLPDKKMYEYFCLERMKRLPESPVSALAFANLFFPNLNVCIQHYIVNGSICLTKKTIHNFTLFDFSCCCVLTTCNFMRDVEYIRTQSYFSAHS